jgi:adenylosuccinate synthase
VPVSAIHSTVGVLKAYATRVGAGPFPTELNDATGEAIRQRGHEFGTTTGRPRRCGWFDAVAAGYAALFTGPTCLALLHLDTLSGFDELKVCVGYRQRGSLLDEFPSRAGVLEEVEPVYETVGGWSEEIGACRHFGDLPVAARGYVRLIAERLGVPVRMIGVGPSREQVILLAEE